MVYFRKPRETCERASSSEPGLALRLEEDPAIVEAGRKGGDARSSVENAGRPVDRSGDSDSEEELSSCIAEAAILARVLSMVGASASKTERREGGRLERGVLNRPVEVDELSEVEGYALEVRLKP